MKFKKFIIGLAILVLTIIFIVFANKAINPEPQYQDCYSGYNYQQNLDPYYGYEKDNYNSYQYQSCQNDYENKVKAYREKSFLIVTILSILAIIAGVLVRSVAPVSWGLVSAGLIMTLYIFMANFEEIGKPYRAIIAGVALAILIWLAYARLGDKEKITNSGNNKSGS